MCVCVCVCVYIYIYISSVQSLSHVQLFVTPWTAACQASLPITNSGSLLRLMFIHQVSDAIQPSISSSVIPFSSCLQFFPASGLFQWVSSSHQVAEELEPQPQHQSFQWIFRTNFLYPLIWSPCSPRTLKSLFQQHSSKASILWHSAFFMVQLSHPYMTTAKATALIWRTFVGKVMSLLFNMLTRLVVAFLSRSKHLLILWLQSPSAVIMEPKKIVCHCFHCFPVHLPWSNESGCHDVHYLNVEF